MAVFATYRCYGDVFPIMAAAAVAIGLVQGMALVIRATLLQRRVPRARLGRVSSVDVFVTLALMPVSTAVTGALSEVVSPETIFAVAGCIPIVAYRCGGRADEPR